MSTLNEALIKLGEAKDSLASCRQVLGDVFVVYAITFYVGLAIGFFEFYKIKFFMEIVGVFSAMIGFVIISFWVRENFLKHMTIVTFIACFFGGSPFLLHGQFYAFGMSCFQTFLAMALAYGAVVLFKKFAAS